MIQNKCTLLFLYFLTALSTQQIKGAVTKHNPYDRSLIPQRPPSPEAPLSTYFELLATPLPSTTPVSPFPKNQFYTAPNFNNFSSQQPADRRQAPVIRTVVPGTPEILKAHRARNNEPHLK